MGFFSKGHKGEATHTLLNPLSELRRRNHCAPYIERQAGQLFPQRQARQQVRRTSLDRNLWLCCSCVFNAGSPASILLDFCPNYQQIFSLLGTMGLSRSNPYYIVEQGKVRGAQRGALGAMGSDDIVQSLSLRTFHGFVLLCRSATWRTSRTKLG
jgi:hypothetical protein